MTDLILYCLALVGFGSCIAVILEMIATKLNKPKAQATRNVRVPSLVHYNFRYVDIASHN